MKNEFHFGSAGASPHRVTVSYLLCLVFLFSACSQKKEAAVDRAATARAVFDKTSKELHIPSASASGAERERLQNEAAKNYLQLVHRFPEQSNLCAEALRSVGNIRAAQTNIDAAVKQFTAVGDKYGSQDWEVLQAWKSAADLLWDAGRRDEAKVFYQKIVSRFDRPEQPAIILMVVRGSKARLK